MYDSSVELSFAVLEEGIFCIYLIAIIKGLLLYLLFE